MFLPKPAQTPHIAVAGLRLPLTIRRHTRARRITLRYRASQGDALLTIPKRASLKESLAFLESRKAWLAARIREAGEKAPFAEGATIPVWGKPVMLQAASGRGVARREGDALLIHGDPAFFARRAQDWLKKEARRELTRLAEEKAARLGARIASITLRDTASRWGSCGEKGDLSFSWRIIFAPYEVFDYLVAHEVAHLKELNHSPRFWAIVQELCPGWRKWRRWLKENGEQLHRYG